MWNGSTRPLVASDKRVRAALARHCGARERSPAQDIILRRPERNGIDTAAAICSHRGGAALRTLERRASVVSSAWGVTDVRARRRSRAVLRTFFDKLRCPTNNAGSWWLAARVPIRRVRVAGRSVFALEITRGLL